MSTEYTPEQIAAMAEENKRYKQKEQLKQIKTKYTKAGGNPQAVNKFIKANRAEIEAGQSIEDLLADESNSVFVLPKQETPATPQAPAPAQTDNGITINLSEEINKEEPKPKSKYELVNEKYLGNTSMRIK